MGNYKINILPILGTVTMKCLNLIVKGVGGMRAGCGYSAMQWKLSQYA